MTLDWCFTVWGYGLGSCWHFMIPWNGRKQSHAMHGCVSKKSSYLNHALAPVYLGSHLGNWRSAVDIGELGTEPGLLNIHSPCTSLYQPLPAATHYSAPQLSEEWFDEKCHCSGICKCEWLLPGEAAILLISHQNGFPSRIWSKPQK